MDYARIENGVVVNVLSIRRTQESEFSDCVPLYDIPAGIGDTYADGKFYRDGAEIKSDAQRLREAEADTAEAFAILRGEVD